jgi:hypothetical protein
MDLLLMDITPHSGRTLDAHRKRRFRRAGYSQALTDSLASTVILMISDGRALVSL